MKKLAYSLTFSLILIVSMASGALGVAIMGDYHSLPPFLTASVTPNLLLLIDNSASMYDLAYIDNQENCYDDSYVPTNTYSGYCEPGTYYKYDETDMQFEATTEALAATFLAGATGTKYVNSIADRDVGIAIDETVTPNVVTAFVAKGNYINWAMASKFDIEKKILTGGKLETTGTYGAPNDRLVMESRGCLDRRFIKKVAVLDASSNTFYLTLGIGGPKEETFPPWENATAYVIGDIVTYMGDLYRATSSGTSSGTGVADDTGVTWAAYTLTRWTDGAWYPANSIVSDNGEMYITALGGTANGTGVADDTGITDWDDYNVTYIEIFPVTVTGFDNTGCQDAIDMLTGVTTLNLGQLKVHIDDCMGYTEGVNQGDVSNYMAAFNHAIHNCWYASKPPNVWPPGAGPVQAIKPACAALYTAAPPINPWDITTDSQGYVCFGAWDVNTASPDDPPAGYVGRCWSPGAGSMICTQWRNPNACTPHVAPDPECCLKWEWSGTNVPGWDAAGYADVDTCIETALQDYCGLLEIPEVVDPTDQASATGTFWNIPAVLIDSGVVAQIGDPLVVIKGYVEQTTAPTGIIQEYAGEAYMGVMSFNDEGSKSECTQPDPYVLYKCTDASNRDGAQVTSDIGSATATLVADINDIDAFAWTPIAEAMYNAIGYYTQNSARRLDPLDFSIGTDPVTEWCQANNVLIITDGASTADTASAVSTLVAGQNDGDTDPDPATCGSLASSPLLDDLTWYAKQGTNIYPVGNELVNGKPKQPITTYIVVAGSMRSTGSGDECSPEILLEHAADNGRGVDDPDGTVDSLYQATDIAELETKLREAFEAILGGASSGTAASVVSAARRGEGALYQAVFYVTYEDNNGTEIKWIGKLHSLFVDQYGNMREDTDGNFTLDLSTDKLITLIFDPSAGRTKAYRDSDSDGDGEADGSPTLIEIDDIEYLWEGGKMLAERTASTRNIYTWIDENNDGVVAGGTNLDTGEYITFDASSKSDLQPYLAVPDITEAAKLINWIRGTDQTGYRSRTIDIDGTNRVWKLGDIIYSTPTVIARPKEKYEFLYSDTSYKTFKNKYADRRNVIYVGANDGMLHAFNAGFYDEANAKFEVGTGTPSYSGATPALGEELWAYIPYNLLPHLRWLKDQNYTHVYYVDLKPKVIDAQIFTADAVHPGGWGTVLFCGMRFGGGPIQVTEAEVGDWNGDAVLDQTMSFGSSYFALDITDPESPPALLWEFTDPNLGFTTSYPAVVHVDHANNDWWIAFGSGPTDYDGTSTQLGRTYVLKLASGTQPNNSPIQTNLGGANTSAMGDVMSVDTDINASQCVSGSCTYTPDVFYIGCSQGTMWRISCVGSNWAGTQTALVSLGNTQPITTAASASQDNDGRLWIYFGTGQFYHENDKANTDTQRLVGVKEPLDWDDCDSDTDTEELTIYCINDCTSATTVPSGNLLDVTLYNILAGGLVDTNDDLVSDNITFDELVEDIKQTTSDTDVPKHWDGWYLDITGGERCFSKPTVLGGIITFTTFEPDDDVCAYEGEGFLYALFYKTGTAFYEDVIGFDGTTFTKSISLGPGVAATPSLHVGTEEGAKAFVQSSTGEIEVIEEINLPAPYKSRPLHWIQPGEHSCTP